MEKLFSVPLKLNSMYLRGDGKRKGSGVAGSLISTDTYFGCFPCEAYSKNTVLKSIRACIRVAGTGIVELHHLNGSGDRTIASKDFSLAAPETIGITVPLSRYASGCLFLRAAGGLDIEGIWYEGEGEAKEARVAVIICTYRREEYILKNLGLLSRTLEEAPDLRENVQVICVDNGGTLDLTGKAGITGTRDKNGSKDTGRICLVRNRNYGGSGGYARGMLEAKRMGCTHFWLMDDDIRFDPAIIRRVFTFLKYRKTDDIALAAGMFSFEQPTVQHEATAVFNGYTFISNAGGLDFRDRDALLKNRVRSSGNRYGGWWSLVMPAADELPMPFFIKLDDVEYGLRLRPAYVIMNGFGVWHEAFGKKGNAWAEYYTARNTLILQDLHPELPRCAVKMMGIRLLKALAYGEPKCMEAALKGAEDYAAGPGSFAATDPEARHKELLCAYRAPLAQDMDRKKMLGAAAGNLLKPKNWKSLGLFVRTVWMLRKRNVMDWNKLRTTGFWREYLGV